MKRIIHLFLTVFSVLGFSAHAESPEVFSNSTAGLTLHKPLNWHYLSVDQNLDNINAIELNDKEFHEAMKKYATSPLVAISKYPEPYNGLNPSFKANLKPYGNFKEYSPKEIINLIIPSFEKAFKDFKIKQKAKNVKVSGIKSAYARFNYSLQIPDGSSYPAASEIWIVPRGNYFFIFGAGTPQNADETTMNEIKSIVNSIEIED